MWIFSCDVARVLHCREYKRDGLNMICCIANHHPEILCIPAELHLVNEAVMLEVLSLCVDVFSCPRRPAVLVNALCFYAVPFIPSDIVTMIVHERLEQFDKTYREYSLAPTEDLIRFWNSKVKDTSAQGHILWTHHSSWTFWAISMKLTGNNL